MVLKIELGEDIDIYELSKTISFVSQSIVGYQIIQDGLLLDVDNEEKADGIRDTIVYMSKDYKKKYRAEGLRTVWSRDVKKEYFVDIMLNENYFKTMGNGLICLKSKAIFLFHYFEQRFAEIAKEVGAIPKMYPVLMPVDEYVNTGYLKRTPQYAIFCCDVNGNIKELEGLESAIKKEEAIPMLDAPRLALSPSACFHTYVELKNKILEDNCVFTFMQNVFRNEGRFGYNEPGRLRDYHVREIVFIGDEKFVREKRMAVIEKTIVLLETWKLQGRIQTAADSFVLPKMQKYKKMQLMDESKYEIRLNISGEKDMATGSYNLHGSAFTYPFNIGVKNCKNPVTGCVGFGIERWVIAFLCQYGDDDLSWPLPIYKAYREYCEKGNMV